MENAVELTPCLSGTAIWKQQALQPYLLQLKQLISAPPDVYQELYMATLLRFAEFCQAMPFDMQQPLPYRLLQRQLELALAALKLRRGRMLPQNSESELIAEQEPLWTYAIFTACLFIMLPRLQQDRSIELFLNKNEKIGEWSVLAGNLFEPQTYYKISDAASKLALVEPDVGSALLIGRIIPSVALRWLASQPAVFTSWWQALNFNQSRDNKDGLVELIQESALKINYPFCRIEQPSGSQFDKPSPKNTLEDLNHWLEQQCKIGDIDAERDLLLRIPSGLFIATNRIADFLISHEKYLPQDKLLQFIDEFLIKENNSVIHRYRPSRFENRLVLEGIILEENYLPVTIRSLPIQSSFVPAIPL